MRLTEMFIEELDREAARSRRVLTDVPRDQDDWVPHPKSMPLGRLAGLVATMPSWIPLILDKDELDLNPPQGRGQYRQPATAELVQVHDEHVSKAREALRARTDDYLLTTNWKLLVSGNVVSDQRRYMVLRDTLNHLAHHRGQLTVYLRLTGQTVPSVYGPSADDSSFG